MNEPERHEKAAKDAAMQLMKLYLERSQHWFPCDKIAFWRSIEQYAKYTGEDIANYGGQ